MWQSNNFVPHIMRNLQFKIQHWNINLNSLRDSPWLARTPKIYWCQNIIKVRESERKKPIESIKANQKKRLSFGLLSGGHVVSHSQSKKSDFNQIFFWISIYILYLWLKISLKNKCFYLLLKTHKWFKFLWKLSIAKLQSQTYIYIPFSFW